MKKPERILYINLLIFAVYTLIYYLTTHLPNADTGQGYELLILGFLVLLHFGLLLLVCLLSFLTGQQKAAQWWALTSLIILLVGFSACSALGG
ncbi:MAG: hypothetical protein KTR13_09760 [Saprospiraceae bacterium]|nr:hypothetical protein [Saprospiraceae bacterium]